MLFLFIAILFPVSVEFTIMENNSVKKKKKPIVFFF